MRLRTSICVATLLLGSSLALAQAPAFSKTVQQFIRTQGARIVLTHVRVVDGTGAAPVEDQNVVIEAGKISSIEPGKDVQTSDGTTVLDLKGYTVLPGLVGMHNHLFFWAAAAAVGRCEACV